MFLLTTAPAPPDTGHWTRAEFRYCNNNASRPGLARACCTVQHCTALYTVHSQLCAAQGSVSLGMLIVMEEEPPLPAGGEDSRHSAPSPPPRLLVVTLLLLLSSLPPPVASHPHCSHHYPRDHQVGHITAGSIRQANSALVISDKASGVARGLKIAALLTTLHICLDSAIRTSHLHY